MVEEVVIVVNAIKVELKFHYNHYNYYNYYNHYNQKNITLFKSAAYNTVSEPKSQSGNC